MCWPIDHSRDLPPSLRIDVEAGPVCEVEGDTFLQGLKKLTQGVARGEATGKLGDVGPAPTFLDMDASGQLHGESCIFGLSKVIVSKGSGRYRWVRPT